MNESLIKAIEAETWAILPRHMEAMLAVSRISTPIVAAKRTQQQAGGIAVIPVYGTITQRGGSLFDMFFGGTSAEGLTAQIRSAISDESVQSIVLDVDSPGGSVGGIQEAFDAIMSMRGQKPITAVANSLMASAAYWLASAADTVIASPSAQIGSIGVFTVHEDISKMAAEAGVKVTMISAGKFKTEGNQFEPLSDEARAAIQKRVDGYYTQFVGSVARGRGVTAGAVRGGFGEGRVVGASEAVSLGMADKVGTLREVLGGMSLAGMAAMHAEDDVEIAAAAPKVGEVEREREKWAIA